MGMLEPVVFISHLNQICMLSISSIRHTKRLKADWFIGIKTAKNNLHTLAEDRIIMIYAIIRSSIVLSESTNNT